MDKMIYIFWTCPNNEEAKRIIHSLLDNRLIACASIFQNVTSIYRWKDRLEESLETKVILKTVAYHFEQVENHIKKLCSYDICEITQVSVENSSLDYLNWVIEETV